jgi:zinc protease
MRFKTLTSFFVIPKILCFFLSVLSVIASAETFSIPVDPQLIQGTLSNGLTYYIRENCYPEKKAAVRLVVKVGSIHEQEDEQGIAHFIEHLVIARGSKHFKDYEIPKYLESIGAWFGLDTNAVTSFDSTQYLFDIPVDQPGYLEKTLQICADIAAFATLEEEGIEKERTVVLDELHQSESSLYADLGKQLIKRGMPNSLYETRFPIGQEAVIKEVTPEKLRAFYHRWYRPDRMALIVVGDFDPKTVEREIVALFAPLPCPEEKVIEPDLNAIPAESSCALIYTQPTFDRTFIELLSYSGEKLVDQKPIETQMVEGLFSQAISDMLQTRLSSRVANGAELIEAYVNDAVFSGNTSCFTLYAGFFEDRVEEGLKALQEEIQSIRSHGFHASEWKVFCEMQRGFLSHGLENLDRIQHDDYASDCIDHFLTHSLVAPKDWAYRSMLSILDSSSVSEVNDYIAISPISRPSIIVFGSPSKKEVSEARLLKILESSLPIGSSFTPTTFAFDGEPKFNRGKIIQVQEEAGIAEWTLSNGIKVYVKTTDLVRDQVILSGFAIGGLAAYSEEVLASASIAANYAKPMLSVSELEQLLKSKAITAGCQMSVGGRTLYSQGPKAHLEFQLQLLHAIFSAPSFNLMYWERLVNLVKQDQKTREHDPNRRFTQFCVDENTQRHLFHQPFNAEMLDEHRARQVFHEAFGAPQEFSFAVVGDFDRAELASLIEKYVASLPVSKKPSLQPATIPLLFPSETIQKVFKAGNNTHATIVLTLPYQPLKLWDHFHSFTVESALPKILEQRLMDVLRINLGKTYGISVNANTCFSPDLMNGEFQIVWTCEPNQCQEMIGLVRQEIARMIKTPPTSDEVKTIQALLREQLKNATITNSYWISLIYHAKMFGISMKESLAAEARILNLTPNSLHEAAQILLSSPHSTTLIHLPGG